MAPRQNPSRLNPLQLRTLTLLQALAKLADCAAQGPGPGEVTVERFPKRTATTCIWATRWSRRKT